MEHSTLNTNGKSLSDIRKIGVYYRVSTDKQELSAQREAVNQWITKQGYDISTITEFVDDGITGAGKILSSERAGFNQLLAAIRAEKLYKLITFEVSRLSRDFLGSLHIMQICADAGVEVEVPGEGVLPFVTNLDKLMASVKAYMAAEEREKVSVRTKAGLAAARARGVRLGPPEGNQHRRGWQKNYPDRLVAMVRLYTAKGLSLRMIAEFINQEYQVSFSTVRQIQKRYCPETMSQQKV